ncbi:MAG: hypothetical protein IJ435_08895 [Clostridia bacterium]|nr:hypothetical protein [Clostridia bacterium]
MFDHVFQKLKKEPWVVFLTAVLSVICIIFAVLFSFSVLQSDDYGYSAYFREGLTGFYNLTLKHFSSTNGRALVHFFLQITLALPSIFVVIIKSFLVFGIGFFAMKVSPFEKKGEYPIAFLIFFYCLLLLSGRGVWKEAIMWTSGFFNYLFPAFITFFAVFLYKRGSGWQHPLCFFAGATTEQWGAASFAIILVTAVSVAKEKKPWHSFISPFLSLLGYGTIFASPATLSRIKTASTPALTGSFFDLEGLGEAFFAPSSPVVPIISLLVLSIVTAIFKRGIFNALYTAIIPLLLIMLLPLHASYTVALIAFVCYLLLCTVVFYMGKSYLVSALLSGALVSIVIMLPTNTFDYRVTFSGALLISIALICMLFDFNFKKQHLVALSCVTLLVAAVAFIPSFKGFYRNYALERQNLEAIEEARETNILNYNIDYDKNYVMRQMFNDGSFYNKFRYLYKLEDCTIYIDSKNAETLYLNGRPLKAKALCQSGEVYVPLRAFTEEAGGSIVSENGTQFIVSGKTLTYLDGILTYTAPDTSVKYLIADHNKILDFYTLYIKLDVVREAFDVRLTIDKS